MLWTLILLLGASDGESEKQEAQRGSSVHPPWLPPFAPLRTLLLAWCLGGVARQARYLAATWGVRGRKGVLLSRSPPLITVPVAAVATLWTFAKSAVSGGVEISLLEIRGVAGFLEAIGAVSAAVLETVVPFSLHRPLSAFSSPLFASFSSFPLISHPPYLVLGLATVLVTLVIAGVLVCAAFKKLHCVYVLDAEVFSGLVDAHEKNREKLLRRQKEMKE